LEEPPLLVRVLGGNVVTTAAVLACLNTADATVLRRLHPALVAAVAAVPWADSDTQVYDPARWRAALPTATTMKLAKDEPLPPHRTSTLAALRGVTVLDLARCISVADYVIADLPATLRALNVSQCKYVSQHVSFAHLPALEWLDCSRTGAVAAGLLELPPSLRELRMHGTGSTVAVTADFSHLRHLRVVTCGESSLASSASAASLPPSLEVLDVRSEYSYYDENKPWPRGWSLAHLIRLRELHASRTTIDDAAIASLPPSLRVLNLERCVKVSLAASFAHLPCLHTLGLHDTPISSDTLATLPPSLVSFNLQFSNTLTPSTVFPHLPALRVLGVSYTGLGDAAVASMPAGLEELHMVCCHNVSQRARLDHLTALRVLQSADTDLSRATIEACRARGCFAPAGGKLLHIDCWGVDVLVPLPDGRLVSGAKYAGWVALWEMAAGHSAVVAELELSDLHVNAVAMLHDGHRVAIGVSRRLDTARSGIVVWDTRDAPHDPRAVTSATIACDANFSALAVALNGWLVAGCFDGSLCVVDVNADVVVATLAADADTGTVTVVAGLLDGRVATASEDEKELRLWDVRAGTRVSTLVGHTGVITSLAVLLDGRLASGSRDSTVRLWDTTSGACMRVLTGDTHCVSALAVLPGNQLATVSEGNTIRVWDTRDDVSGARPPLVSIIDSGASEVLVALPGNRLATGGDGVYLWQLPPPRST